MTADEALTAALRREAKATMLVNELRQIADQMRADREAFQELAAHILNEFSKRLLEKQLHESLKDLERKQRKSRKDDAPWTH